MALAQLGPEAEDAVPALLEALTDPSVLVQDRAAWALGRLGAREAVAPLISTLHSRNGGLRATAAGALGEIADARAVSALVKVLDSDHTGLQWHQIDFAGIDAKKTDALYVKVKKLEALYVKGLLLSAVCALERIDDPTSLMALIDACGHSDPDVSRVARSALKKLYSPEPRGPGRLRAYNTGEVLHLYRYYDSTEHVKACRSVRMKLFVLSVRDAGSGAAPLLAALHGNTVLPEAVRQDALKGIKAPSTPLTSSGQTSSGQGAREKK